MTSNSEVVANDVLRKRDLTLSEAGKFAVLGWLDSNLQVRHDSAGKLSVTVLNEDGSEIAPEAFFADWTARHPGYFASAKPAARSTSKEPTTMTSRMIATVASQKAGSNDRAAEIAKTGNPWLASSQSMTRAALITNLDPVLAVQLRQEAGIGHD
jgi:hypothetical protein